MYFYWLRSLCVEQNKVSLKLCVFLRLAPVAPFAPVSLALAALDAPLAAFAGGTLLGVAPATLLCALLGNAAADADADATSTYVSIALSLVAAVGAARVAQNELKKID